MTRIAAIALFTGVLLLTMILRFPLGAGLAYSGLSQSGLSARAARGTIWSGSLEDARLGPVALGDVAVALNPLPLLAGRIDLDLTAASGAGKLFANRREVGASDVTARLSLRGAFRPLPVDIFKLSTVTVKIEGDRCTSAAGRIDTVLVGKVAGLDLTSSLSGALRCDAGQLVLPLVNQSKTQRLVFHLAGNGHWRAVLTVRTTESAEIERLGKAGFKFVANGHSRAFSGRW